MLSLLRRIVGPRDDGVFRRIPLLSSGQLFASPMPFGAYDRGNRILKIYKRKGIDHVIMLVTEEELEEKARRDLKRLNPQTVSRSPSSLSETSRPHR